MISEELRARLIRIIQDGQRRYPVTIIPKDKWAKSVTPDFPLRAIFHCPDCGLGVGIGKENHTIADDGTVSPSMVCPHAPCTFHKHIKLEGWSD